MVYLSLCMATNGVTKWVMPALEAIYSQGVDENLVEVVVADNGDSDELEQTIQPLLEQHSNLHYKRTQAVSFGNQIEALRMAKGEYLKFINHRTILEPGALQWMLDLVQKYIDIKPVIYMSSGSLELEKPMVCKNFDEFVRGLRQFASWTTGVGVWRSDFEQIPADHKYSNISPHSDVLFWVRDRAPYVIDDTVWGHDITQGHEGKGTYDLYACFGWQELTITLSLLRDGSISPATFRYVRQCYKDLLISLYYNFTVKKVPCSYDLSGFEEAMGVFFDKSEILRAVRLYPVTSRIRDYKKRRK